MFEVGQVEHDRSDGLEAGSRHDLGWLARAEHDDELAVERGIDIVTFRDWQKIEQAEEAAARAGAPREKFVDIASMIAAKGM